MINTPTKINSSQINSKKITIIVADDHPIVRKALKNEFQKEADVEVLAEASDGEEAVKLVTELKPDAIIMDIGMSKLNGIEATRRIKTLAPDTVVLVLTVYDDIEHVLEMLKSGADGYLTKTILVEDIIKSIRSVIAGEMVISPLVFKQVLKYALRYSTKPIIFDSNVKLTIRELEILKLLGRGMGNKNIAQELNLGTRTVKSHLVDIYSKLRVFSRTEAVIIALRAGLLTIDDLV
jgi:DNA-binding NarL/FixJ family response regulator